MKISTSILNSNDIPKSLKELNNTNTKYIHIDVMDGIFVPNKSILDINKIKEINKISEKKLDIHLMVENPIDYINELDNLNIEYITIHIEINKDINKLITIIKEKGYKVGLSIKPDTEIKDLIPYLPYIDLILIMSVEPGKGGQPFIENTINKIKELKKIILNKNILIEVDGGINNNTIKKVKDIDIAVSGTYITQSNDYNNQINKLITNSKITIIDKIKDIFK